MTEALRIFDREKQDFFQEKVYGGAAVQALYGNSLGYWFTDHVLSRPFLSRIVGGYYGSSISRGKIQPFIQKFEIELDEYLDESYASFNAFFVRRFKEGRRPFEPSPDRLAAFAEGRYLAFNGPMERVPVKGFHIDPMKLLGRSNRSGFDMKIFDSKIFDSRIFDSRIFEGGPLLIARLCPVDYHRFHFPADGKILDSYRIHGKLHSVNPLALERDPRIFLENERVVTLLDCQSLGRMAYVEVGALCVGKIVLTDHSIGRQFRRGDEKGHFLFGGSTVILFGEKGKWRPDDDLLEHSSKGIETFVKLGKSVGQ